MTAVAVTIAPKQGQQACPVRWHQRGQRVHQNRGTAFRFNSRGSQLEPQPRHWRRGLIETPAARSDSEARKKTVVLS